MIFYVLLLKIKYAFNESHQLRHFAITICVPNWIRTNDHHCVKVVCLTNYTIGTLIYKKFFTYCMTFERCSGLEPLTQRWQRRIIPTLRTPQVATRNFEILTSWLWFMCSASELRCYIFVVSSGLEPLTLSSSGIRSTIGATIPFY